MEDQPTSSEYLTSFFNTLPIQHRSVVPSILSQISRNLDNVIPNHKPISSYLEKIRQLRVIFMRMPFSVRKSLKCILLDGLENCLHSQSITICIFTTCLCLLELSAFRNCDRSDLESEEIWTTVVRLKENILPKLTESVIKQRTNLPSLLSWSTCMLVFTSRVCFEWILHQDYQPSDCAGLSMLFKKTKILLDHPSIPTLMHIVLRAQCKQRPYLEPPFPHTLFDLLFANVISNSAGLLHSSKPASKPNPNKCILEQSEPRLRPSKLKCPNTPVHITFSNEPNQLPSSFKEGLHSNVLADIFQMLQILRQLVLDQTSLNDQALLDSLIYTLKETPFVLNHIRQREKDDMFVVYYEQIYCLFLQLWYYVAERRILLTKFPQSYVWLVGFAQPNYEIMSMDGFVQCIVWTSRFLTIYQTLFRSSIMASPHWYLQMIADGAIATIDRSEKVQTKQRDEDDFQDSLCMCMLAISKPFSALRIEESGVHEELSRTVKVPLELILGRMAACKKVVELPGDESKKSSIERLPIGPRLRDVIQNHLIFPMIRASDTWALGQTRIGIRPASARALLRQLLNTNDALEPSREAVHVTSKLDFVKPLPAVGGLHAVHKVGMKRKIQ